MFRKIKSLLPPSFFSFYHYVLSFLGNLLYGFPSNRIHVVGVTGTKGKTTIAYLIYQLLQKNNEKAALTSTVFFALGDELTPNALKMGMPGRFFLPRFIRKAVKRKLDYAVIETTSEGILQHRQRFLNYKTAVFSGLSPEHVEHHGGFLAYRQTKEKLFRQCSVNHILNLQDKHVLNFLKYPAKNKWGIYLGSSTDEIEQSLTNYGNQISTSLVPKNIIEGSFIGPSKIRIREFSFRPEAKLQLTLMHEFETDFPFIGNFNLQNLLLATATARSLGTPMEKVVSVIQELKSPPGRMEEYVNKAINFRVFLDYAHEPLSLKSVLESCKILLPKEKKLICLTGSQGGGRDKWKRKVMGSIASRLCDYIIVATEDPYQEDPENINREVLDGVLANNTFQENVNCWKILDRKEAIRKAISLAKEGDVVILAGKGGEKKMCIANGFIPWDEKGEVEKAIAELK